MYSTENSGGSDSDLEEVGVGSPLELVIGASEVASGLISEVVKEISWMELSIAEFDESPEPVLSIGGRSDADGVAEFRPGEETVSETLPGTNFFLQSWQILLRSLSSSSESVVAIVNYVVRFSDRR